MANRRPQMGGRREFNRNDRGKAFGRSNVSPWQGDGPGAGLSNLFPLAGGTKEAQTLALASNIISLLQPRQNPVPSLLDMPIRRDFGPNVGRFDRGFVPNRMGNQGNFRRTGNYNRAGERINNRKPFKPNDGQRQHNKSSPKKDADSKSKPVKESETQSEKKETQDNEAPDTEKKEKEGPKTRYDDVNHQFLKCHICNKSMWDGRSFENHLNGRAHSIMMQKTAESYALTADTMRQEYKIREMKRYRKSGQQPARDFYCAMCDMYASDGAIHRTTVGHRKLKKYLHPTCTTCRKEMPTRIELDEHRLTPEHLKKLQDCQETVTKPKPEVMVISTMSMEQTYLREDWQRRRGDEKRETEVKTEDASQENENEEGKIKTEPNEETSEETQPTEGEEAQSTENPPIDNNSTIVDYKEGDDLSNVTKEMFPSYSVDRGVGRSFLQEFRCVQCSLCRKLLDSEETADVHLRTWRHHQLFVRMLAEKSGQQTQEPAVNKRPSNDDESGNWKRRKTDGDNNRDENGHDDDDQEQEPEREQTKGVESEAEIDANEAQADDLEDWDQPAEDEEVQDNNKDAAECR